MVLDQNNALFNLDSQQGHNQHILRVLKLNFVRHHKVLTKDKKQLKPRISLDYIHPCISDKLWSYTFKLILDTLVLLLLRQSPQSSCEGFHTWYRNFLLLGQVSPESITRCESRVFEHNSWVDCHVFVLKISLKCAEISRNSNNFSSLYEKYYLTSVTMNSWVKISLYRDSVKKSALAFSCADRR